MTCCADNICVTKQEGDCDRFACDNWCKQSFADGRGTCIREGDPLNPKYICNCFHKCSI